jgi:prolyl oligopeptidase
MLVRKAGLAGISAALLLSACSPTEAPPVAAPNAATAERSATPVKLDYPASRTVQQTDDYHGTVVADPYRWLEELDSTETRAWIDAQNKVTNGVLEGLPLRAKFKARMTELWNYERYGIPSNEGGKYFLSRNDGLQPQSVLYWMSALDAEPKVLIDPNTLSDDGTVALAGTAVSKDGKYIAYSTSSGGSDWQQWKVREIETGKDLDDVIDWSKFSGASWAPDGSGFYYSRYDAPPEGADKLKAQNENQKVYFHPVGKAQSEDSLVYARPDQPLWGFGAGVTDDGRYLLINVSLGTDERNLVFYRDLQNAKSDVVELISDFEASYAYVGNVGSRMFFLTNLDAPRYRLIEIDVNAAQRDNWKTLIAESADTLQSVNHVGGKFVATYLKDARSAVRLVSLDGSETTEFKLPGTGTVNGFGGEADSMETFYSFSSYTVPTDIYRLDLKTGESSLFRSPKTPFDGSQFETTQVFYTSKDGTKVPMFITARKGLARNGDTPTILYGYGGFNISVVPGYSPAVATWLDMGGIWAVANLRGGGEYGSAWHEGGMKLNKQNVFDDFAAAAEYLIAEKYTSAKHLGINGRSNGGLLVAATLLQRPELFAAAIPAVGVLDMLRFREFTIGWAWESDYGSVRNPEEFKAIHAYSPLHNIQPGKDYPPTLVLTGDHDDRVFPAHSFKYAAAVQAVYQGENPQLIRIETKGGHGAGKPTAMIIEENADWMAFVAKYTGMR